MSTVDGLPPWQPPSNVVIEPSDPRSSPAPDRWVVRASILSSSGRFRFWYWSDLFWTENQAKEYADQYAVDGATNVKLIKIPGDQP